MLHENPDILIVLNHPLWDLARYWPRAPRSARYGHMLCEQGEYLHALELSGIRSWEENQAVLHLSEACNQLVISGGDRHGCEPNATLNLTDAESFTEFVHKVRKDRRSHILFMPQYDEPYTLRVLQTLLEVIREYPDDSSGSRHWDERVFHPDHAGVIRPLSALWVRPPFYIRHFFRSCVLLEQVPVRRAVRSALARPQPSAIVCAWRRPGGCAMTDPCLARGVLSRLLRRNRRRCQYQPPVRSFCADAGSCRFSPYMEEQRTRSRNLVRRGE